MSVTIPPVREIFPNSIRCFWLEPTDQVEMSLRRYRSAMRDKSCPTGFGYHDASIVIGRGAAAECPEFYDHGPVHGDVWSHDDARWPKACACGFQFAADDEWQFNSNTLFRRTDTDEMMTLAVAPVGAMWNAPWLADNARWRGPDGLSLIVRTPGGDWTIDGKASNCTMIEDTTHKCWVRHGTPPNLTVDKNGHTCAAGAGSILQDSYHGFLRDGFLVVC